MQVHGTYPTNKTMGVYCLTNTLTGHVYVGSSKRMLDRLTDHKRDLRNGGHRNKYLQRAYNKYGIDAFEYVIIEMVDNENDLLFRENEWIKTKEATDPDRGYNFMHYDRRMNDGTPELRYKTKRYFVVSPDGETFDVSNLSDFCRKNDLDGSRMRAVARGKCRHSKYWRCWEWVSKPDEIENLTDFRDACEIYKAETNRTNIAERNATQHKWMYCFVNEHGQTFYTKSVKRFCAEQRINSREMLKLAKGDRSLFKGWSCSRTPI